MATTINVIWEFSFISMQLILEQKGVAEAFGHHQKHHPWSYNTSSADGPEHWGSIFPYCNQNNQHNLTVPHINRQSPINIDTYDVFYGDNFRLWWTYENPTLQGTITESHKAPVFQIEYGLAARTAGTRHKRHVIGNHPRAVGTSYFLMGVPNNEGRGYKLHQFHFHFCDVGVPGSEHAVDMKKFDAEVHFVHYNSKYKSFEEAVDKSDGLMVVAIFLQVGQQVDPIMDSILEKFHAMQHQFDYKVVIPTIDVLKPNTDFYMYHGSTTAPSCHEHVQWFVQREPITIAQKHLGVLRKLRCKSYNNGERIALFGNTRPLQIHYRPKVRANFLTHVLRPGWSAEHNHGPELSIGTSFVQNMAKEPGVNLDVKNVVIGSQSAKVDTPVLHTSMVLDGNINVQNTSTQMNSSATLGGNLVTGNVQKTSQTLNMSTPTNTSMRLDGSFVSGNVQKTGTKQAFSVHKGTDIISSTREVQTAGQTIDVNHGVGKVQSTDKIQLLQDLLRAFVGKLSTLTRNTNENVVTGKMDTISGFDLLQERGQANHVLLVQSQKKDAVQTQNKTTVEIQQSGSGQSQIVTEGAEPIVAGQANVGDQIGGGQTQTQEAGNGQGTNATGSAELIVSGNGTTGEQAGTAQAMNATGGGESLVAGEPNAGGEQAGGAQTPPAEQAQEGPSQLETQVMNAVETGITPNFTEAQIQRIRTNYTHLLEDLADLYPNRHFPELA